ncbi:hypothetical protein VST7929_02771 [Vibrio stylophorae]|uniref:Transposase n=1 Tax=Vibrio stylophorae TaxID=659351 RepID=A0ABM8ZXV6_9VIBR|nr:hypothetical protein VST7929_02771 [Vibrio stylophorae]
MMQRVSQPESSAKCGDAPDEKVKNIHQTRRRIENILLDRARKKLFEL